MHFHLHRSGDCRVCRFWVGYGWKYSEKLQKSNGDTVHCSGVYCHVYYPHHGISHLHIPDARRSLTDPRIQRRVQHSGPCPAVHCRSPGCVLSLSGPVCSWHSDSVRNFGWSLRKLISVHLASSVRHSIRRVDSGECRYRRFRVDVGAARCWNCCWITGHRNIHLRPILKRKEEEKSSRQLSPTASSACPSISPRTTLSSSTPHDHFPNSIHSPIPTS
mmetsp:Transcript_68537/g.79862  ORF Transcript_68537/g.79862 Transcript_68537/m.79862 type:complete len:218 (+) Transcript_68537:445-1098(+)